MILITAGDMITMNSVGRMKRIIGTVISAGRRAALFSARSMRCSRNSADSTRMAWAMGVPYFSVWMSTLMMPRIPGGDRYLEALAIAVRRAVAGELSCEAALADASAQWTSITAELGVPQQAAAYRRQLDLEESAPP